MCSPGLCPLLQHPGAELGPPALLLRAAAGPLCAPGLWQAAWSPVLLLAWALLGRQVLQRSAPSASPFYLRVLGGAEPTALHASLGLNAALLPHLISIISYF